MKFTTAALTSAIAVSASLGAPTPNGPGPNSNNAVALQIQASRSSARELDGLYLTVRDIPGKGAVTVLVSSPDNRFYYNPPSTAGCGFGRQGQPCNFSGDLMYSLHNLQGGAADPIRHAGALTATAPGQVTEPVTFLASESSSNKFLADQHVIAFDGGDYLTIDSSRLWFACDLPAEFVIPGVEGGKGLSIATGSVQMNPSCKPVSVIKKSQV